MRCDPFLPRNRALIDAVIRPEPAFTAAMMKHRPAKPDTPSAKPQRGRVIVGEPRPRRRP